MRIPRLRDITGKVNEVLKRRVCAERERNRLVAENDALGIALSYSEKIRGAVEIDTQDLRRELGLTRAELDLTRIAWQECKRTREAARSLSVKLEQEIAQADEVIEYARQMVKVIRAGEPGEPLVAVDMDVLTDTAVALAAALDKYGWDRGDDHE